VTGRTDGDGREVRDQGGLAVAGLSETDVAIVRHLQRDGRAPYRRIASELGLTEATVRKRAQALLERNLIQVVAIPNAQISGPLILTVVSIKVSRQPEKVAEQMVDWPDVPWITLCSNEILIAIYARDFSSVVQRLREIQKLDGIHDVSSYVCLQTLKHTYVRHFRSQS
jgi:Lrp/AsnC family transcriptional regulator for asnA, asnC and gidA